MPYLPYQCFYKARYIVCFQAAVESLILSDTPLSPSTMLSTVQLLAIPIPPPSASYVESPIRWAHCPSPRDSTFHGILLSTLFAVTPATIIRFKKFIRSMSNRFHPTPALNLSGYSVSSQFDVASYLQSQVLDAAWQAVLGMVSSEKDYELRAIKLFGIDVCHSLAFDCSTDII